MLATDLHSPSVKNKMTKPEWINLQSKNNDGKNFEHQFLSDIFDRIAAQEIKLQDDDNFTVDDDLGTDPKQLRNRFQKEMERNITKSKQLLKEKSKDKTTYYRAKQIELVRPMFEIAWGPMLAAFSVLLEDSDDQEIILLCLEGIKHNIRVSCTFFMDVERNTFVTSLSKFTFLNNIREMKQKNIESIKALMEIARTEGNYLGDSWLPILRCISHLEQLHLIGSGGKAQPFELHAEDPKKTPPRTTSRLSINMPFTKKFQPSTTSQFAFHENTNAHLIAEQIDSMDIDKIFTSSASLNSNSIEVFVKCLTQVG